MAQFKRMLAFLLVLTMMLSCGEVLVAADGEVPPAATEVPATAEPEPTDVPATEEPAATEVPATAEPEPTDVPATEEPAATEVPATEEPAATDVPATEEPAATEVPATEEPAATEVPATAEPAATEVPATAEPEPTDVPATEEPAATDEPAVTPVPSEDPETTPEPSEDPEATPEPTEDPEATPEPSEEPVHKEWSWTEPGNTSASLMGGGWSLVSGSSYYYSERGLYLNGSKLADTNVRNLNLSDGWLYYTVDNSAIRMPSGGGSAETVFTAESTISQMYVMGQEIRYLSGGSLYSYDMGDGAVEALECPAGTEKFIPTPYGNLFFTGSLFNYTLWAEQTQLRSGITSAYIDGDWLVVTTGGETMQASTAALFEGSCPLQEYSLHQDLLVGSGLSDDAQLANEEAYLQSSAYEAIQSARYLYSSSIRTGSTSAVLNMPLSANQQNIVLRARQMAEVKWVALADRYAWGGNDNSYVSRKGGDSYIKDVNGKGSGEVDHNKWGYFLANHTYKGVPYSQAVSTGYVGWNISLNDFLRATNTQGGVFYTSNSTYDKTAPYYGSDCSGFASWAWDLPLRCTCTSMLNFSKAIGRDINSLQVGDVLNNPSSHVVLVSDIGYDSSGKIVSVEITEQTPPIMRVTCYGEAIDGKTYDYTSSLSALTTYFLNSGYTIYRRSCSRKPNVSRPADVQNQATPAAPYVEDIVVAGPDAVEITLAHATSNATIYYTKDGTKPQAVDANKYTGPFKVTRDDIKDGKVTIRAIARVPNNENDSFVLAQDLGESPVPVLTLAGAEDSSGVYFYDDTYYVPEGAKLSLKSSAGGNVYYTVDGSEPNGESSSVTSSTAIESKNGMIIKAIAMAEGCLPSEVAVFKVEHGVMYTITLDDPYGFITPVGFKDRGEEIYVLSGESVEFQVADKTSAGYTLASLLVDGKETTERTIKWEKVDSDHTIKASVQLGYTDLTADWYKEAVAFATVNGLMNGTSKDKFSPNYGTSRAMFITVLGRYAKATLNVSTSSTAYKSIDVTTLDTNHRVGITNGYDINVRSAPTTSVSNIVTMLEASGQMIEVIGSQTVDNYLWYLVNYNGRNGYVCQKNPSNGKILMDVCNFGDITADNLKYCNGYVQWAYLNKLVNGVSNSSFGSTNGISRQDICVILYKYLTEVVGMKLDTTAHKTFKDSSAVADYAKNAVNAMVNIGVIQGGTDGKIQPMAVAQRAQVAIMFLNLDNYLNG